PPTSPHDTRLPPAVPRGEPNTESARQEFLERPVATAGQKPPKPAPRAPAPTTLPAVSECEQQAIVASAEARGAHTCHLSGVRIPCPRCGSVWDGRTGLVKGDPEF